MAISLTQKTNTIQIGDPRWLSFVSAQPEATIFHHPAWSQLLAESYGYHPSISVMERDGEIIAGLPLMDVESRLTGRRKVALPFSDFCPPLSRDIALLPKYIEALQEQQRAENWTPLTVHWDLPRAEGVYPRETVARHVTTLTHDPEQLRRRFRSNVQRLIRQAEHASLTIRLSRTWVDVCAFYNLHLVTRRRQGTPIQPLRFFRLLWERIVGRGLGFVILANHDESARYIAGAVFLHWNKTLTYKYGASLPDALHLRPNNLIMWEALRWG